MKNMFCSIFLSFMLMVFFLPSSQAHAGNRGEFYDQCWVEMNDKIPQKKLEKACSCTQKKGEEYLSKGIPKTEMETEIEKAMSDCFLFSLRSFAQMEVYRGCMNNKYAGYQRYQLFCKCSAIVYSKELLKYGVIAFEKTERGDEINKKAVKTATDVCTPSDVKKKRAKKKKTR